MKNLYILRYLFIYELIFFKIVFVQWSNSQATLVSMEVLMSLNPALNYYDCITIVYLW